MSLKVLYVITDSGVGGSEHVMHNLLRMLDRKKVQPAGVVVLKKKRESALLWEQTGIPVVALNMNKIPGPGVLWRLRNEIKKHSPDVVHAFLYHSVQASRLVKWVGGQFSLISSPRVNYRFAPKLGLFVDQLLKGNDDKAVCESRATAQFLEEKLDYEKSRVEVVSNGVDVQEYKFNDEARRSWREHWRIPPNEILIGGVGRLHDQKGFDVLLESLSLLKKIPTPHRLVLIGEGPEEARLRQLAKNYSMNVLFPGLQSEMADVYSALDIFVQSSRYEGMSNALLEALSVGLPCVATAVDGTLDLAIDGENMVLVKPEDPISLSVGLGYVLEKKALREKLSRNGRKTAEEFSVQATINAFQKIYQSLAKN